MNVIVDRRMLKDRTAERCYECGKKDYEAIVQLGEAEEAKGMCSEDWMSGHFCLPCLKRAVAEAEAAVAKDKG